MPSFQQRLKTCMRRGNLRTADVARWFDRRHSTIRGWIVDGREPAGTPTDIRVLFERLVELEGLVPKHRAATGQEVRNEISAQT